MIRKQFAESYLDSIPTNWIELACSTIASAGSFFVHQVKNQPLLKFAWDVQNLIQTIESNRDPRTVLLRLIYLLRIVAADAQSDSYRKV